MSTGVRLSLLFVAAAAVWAQSDANKGSLLGFVADSSGANMPQATITATNNSTGLERQAKTNDAGQYHFAALDPGSYQLRVEGPTFTAAVSGVEVTVGRASQVNITVAFQERPVVDLSASFVTPTNTYNNQVLAQEAIRDLPINGRRFQEFATLTPTVLAIPETRGQLSFVGQRGVNSNVMVDGVDYNDPFLGGIRGGERSLFAFSIPQSAVREFQVVTAGYSPEYGRSTGGILNAITRAGINDLHGEAFYQLRNETLSARTPLKQTYLDTQHQFGGAFGGPLKKDRLFFFGAAEQQLASFPRQVRFPVLDAVADSVTPEIAPAYQYFRSLETNYEQTNDATAVIGRLDYQFRGASRLTGRYQFSRNHGRNATATGASLAPQINQALSSNGDELGNIHAAVGQWTSVISPYIVNDVRMQYSREERSRLANSAEPFIQAGIIGTVGTDQFLPSSDDNYRLQFADSLDILTGRHNLKMGADFNYIGANRWFGVNQFGGFLLSGSDPRSILRILSASGGTQGNRFDDPSVIYRRQVGNLAQNLTSSQLAFFFQDTWRPGARVSFNFGLRWEGQFFPSPALDNEFLVTNVRDFNFPLGRIDPTVVRDQLGQWAPSAGFSWDVSGSGNTILRGQAGIHYAQTPLLLLAAPLTNFGLPPGDLTLQIAPGGGRTVYGRFADAGFDFNRVELGRLPVYTVDDVWMRVAGQPNPFAGARVTATSGDRFRNPRAAQASLSVAHQFSTGLVFDYTLNHVNTVHLQRNVDFNVPAPVVRPGDESLRPFFGLRSGTPRPNRNLAWVMVRDASARSTFTGNTFRLQYRVGRIQFAGHYTLSYNKSDDDTERVLTEIAYQNPFDFSRDFNWSSLDSRHQISGFGMVDAPLGIQLAGILHYRSAQPLDAAAGQDLSELLTPNLTTRPLESPGLAFARNAFRNRDYTSLDLRFLKSFPVSESARVQFSCEVFNVLNSGNVGFIPAATLPNNPAFIHGPGILPNGQTAPRDARFMRIRRADGSFDPAVSAQVGTPLQGQLGLRLVF
jgi:hypothetical protein